MRVMPCGTFALRFARGPTRLVPAIYSFPTHITSMSEQQVAPPTNAPPELTGPGAGCLVLTAVLCVPGVIAWLASLLFHSLWLQALALLVAVVVLVLIALNRLQTGQKVAMVLGGFSLWVAATTAFAAVYAFIYIQSPNSFRVTRDVLDETTRTQISDRTTDIQAAMERRYYVGLVAASAEPICAAINRPAVHQGMRTIKAVDVHLTPIVTFTMLDVNGIQRVGSNSEAYRDTDITLTRNGTEVWSMVPDLARAPEVDPERRVAQILANRCDAASLRTACQTYDGSLTKQIDHDDSQVAQLVAHGAALDISHFVYLSAASASTLGTADIAPNSSFTRYTIVLQGFVTVFLFGYALGKLWS